MVESGLRGVRRAARLPAFDSRAPPSLPPSVPTVACAADSVPSRLCPCAVCLLMVFELQGGLSFWPGVGGRHPVALGGR